MSDAPITLPFGLTSGRITALVTAAVVFTVIAYFFKDDIDAVFTTKQRNKAASDRSIANAAKIKSIQSDELDHRNGVIRRLSDVESKLSSLEQSRRQAKLERDKNTEFAAKQPARGQRRTERLDAQRRDIGRLEDSLEKVRDQHTVPGKHPLPEH